ncbi:MAG: tyrosine-type recombinase/integrase [Candidatus Margulisiibacteriota bacterium]
MTINQKIDQFKQFLSIQKQRSGHTISNYITDIQQFFNVINVKSVTQVNHSSVEIYLTHLHQRQLSSQSIYRKLVSLDQFWRFLQLKHGVDSNPWADVKRPKLTRNLPVFIEEKIVFELLQNYPTSSAEDIRNKAILELLFASGIRVSELTSLTQDSLNLDQNECRVLGKGSKHRIALFGDRAKLAIQQYIKEVRPRWASDSVPHLFISKQGKKLTSRTVQRVLKSANQFHSSPIEITPHACRHTCASLLIINGANIRDVQEFLGHQSISTTERYTHIPNASLTKRFLNAIE